MVGELKGSAWGGRDDRGVSLGDGVEQRRLAGVGGSDDDDPKALPEDLTPAAVREVRMERGEDGLQPR